MISKLDNQQQRQLAIGILAAAVIALFLITAGPVWLANASRQATLDDAYERLHRYQQIAARDAEMLPQYEAQLQRQRQAGNHLRSETSAVAGAELQRIVKSVTASNSAQILSTQLLPVSEEQGFLRVALKVRLRGELPAIVPQGRLRPMDAEFELVAYMPEAS